MGRKGGRNRCPYDRKSTFRSRRLALRTARQLPDPDNRVYWCQYAGGYHLTRYESGEYDRRQAGKLEGKKELMQPRLTEIATEIIPTRPMIGRGGDCPTCGWLHGFHDPILHNYHNVLKALTWKPSEPAPWEEPKPQEEPKQAQVPSGQVTQVVNPVEKRAAGLDQLSVARTAWQLRDQVDETLSVLKGLNRDDLV